LICTNVFPQHNELSSLLVRELLNKGYENVRIKIESDRVIVAYENRVYRYDVKAIREVLKIVGSFIVDQKEVVLIPQNRKIPIVAMESEVSDLKKYISAEITAAEYAARLNIIFNTDDIWQNMKNETEYNSSNTKFDVTLKPTVAASFGEYTDPVRWQLNIVPGIRTSFWEGMRFDYQLIIPVHNDLLPIEDSVRTGLAVINQTIRFPNSLFISTSLGYFTKNRYGFDIEGKKYFSNGNINIGMNLGYTSYLTFAGFHYYYSTEFELTGSISGEFRIPEYDLSLNIAVGKFLYGDKSVRFDLIREFGEVNITFTFIKSTNRSSNYGFGIMIPIFPDHYSQPAIVRVRPDEYFSLNYLVRNNYADLVGTQYDTGNSITQFLKKLNPDFIKNNFSEISQYRQ